jgi:hypothetical protein
MSANPPFNSGGSSASATVEPTKKSHVLLYAIIGIVIIGIGVGIYLYLKSRKTTTTGTTGHGTSGTSGNTGHSGVSGSTGTTGTTGATGGSTGPCVAPGITMNALVAPWFVYGGSTPPPNSTSFTMVFNTTAIPSNNFPLFITADSVIFEAYVPGTSPNAQYCAASIPFPGPYRVLSSSVFGLTIPHNSTYPTDNTINTDSLLSATILNTFPCTAGSLPDCSTTQWSVIFTNAALVNACGVTGPSQNLFFPSIFTLGGGVCALSSAFNFPAQVL